MSFEFQSTLVDVTPNYRISGAQIGGVSVEMVGDIKVATLVLINDKNIKFALSGPYKVGDPDAIYAALAPELFELTPGILVNEGAIGYVEITAEKIIVDLEGSDLKYAFMPDAEVTGPVEVGTQTYKITTAGFAALTAAATNWRSSMDGTLQGLSTAITNEIADRIAAITAEEQRVDALIASGMWLYASQADFPSAADNHGRVVHSHADGAIFYAHGGVWHKIENEAEAEAGRAAIQADVDQNEADADTAIAAEAAARDAADQTIIDSVANEATARAAADVTLQANIDAEAATRAADDTTESTARAGADAALSARLDVLEADPTTAAAVAAGDAATLSSANSYTDTAVSNVIGSAPGVLDTLGEIADAINDDANAYTTLVTQIAAVQTDVDGNETDGDAADAALSARLDVLEADPTTATAVAAVQADVDQNEADADAADSALSARLDVLEADPTTATAVAAVQADVDQNEADADAAMAGEATTRANADTALSGRLDVLEADPTTATAVAAVQADVDQNESDSDAADAALSARLDVLEADPTTATAVAAVQADVDQNEADSDAAIAAETAARIAGDTAANTYTDTKIADLIGAAPGVLDTLEEIANSINDDADVYTNIVSQIVSGDTAEATTRAAADTALQADIDQNESDSDAADAALSGRLDVLEADPTTATALAAVQADVDQNETDSDAADAALSGRLDVLEADPTTATAVAAVQADVNQNETDADAADAALSARLDVLEADPTTATAVAAVQSDVDQNEADADAALALKAPLADPDFTGLLEVDTNARLEFDSNLTKLHNVLRGTSIVIGNNITLNPAAADGRVEIEGEFYLRPSDLTNAADDTAAAAAGVIVGQVYRNGSQLMVRVS